MLTVSAIAHVAIKVKDIDASLDFYVNRLGFEELMRLDKDGRLWLVYLRITDEQFLEIFPDGTGAYAIPESVGYNHMCLSVPDIEKAVDELTAAGIAFLRQKKLGVDGNWQCWIEDPDGHPIEVMQMMPESMQLRAISR
jgi:lactoylglutathione lyase